MLLEEGPESVFMTIHTVIFRMESGTIQCGPARILPGEQQGTIWRMAQALGISLWTVWSLPPHSD